MTATNHFLGGMIIAGLCANPAIGLPLAFGAHFAMDAVPHFGGGSTPITARKLNRILAADALVGAMVLLFVLLRSPDNWPYLVLGGALCSSPDFMWMPNHIRELAGRAKKPSRNVILRFHKKIQWCERPWGIWLELVYFGLMTSVLLRYIL